jgi:chemotaxis response regulator CheB
MSDAIPGQPEPSATDSALRPVSSSLSFPVVGIGASAGGVRALLEFFENAPTDMAGGTTRPHREKSCLCRRTRQKLGDD